jgi:succinate dehydrogenase hydrophobic membrane anchor protein
LALLLVNGTPNAAQWQALFGNVGFKLATLLALIATAYHGLVGAMHVWPDYVKSRAVLAVLNAYSWIAAAAIVLWAVYILFGMK